MNDMIIHYKHYFATLYLKIQNIISFLLLCALDHGLLHFFNAILDANETIETIETIWWSIVILIKDKIIWLRVILKKLKFESFYDSESNNEVIRLT